jgi:CheY-like chemotaxis protein
VTQIEPGGGPTWNPNTILIVEDDTDMRESLRDVLGAEGYSVVQAGNGKLALDLLPGLKRPCGIILDVTMPVMNGTEFYQAMLELPDSADIPVVFLTSDLSRAPIGLPMMQKTISLDRLLGKVAALF